eukprot:SAG22_NODE_1417_length_4469_cov_2.981465_2_plen_207_part_00
MRTQQHNTQHTKHQTPNNAPLQPPQLSIASPPTTVEHLATARTEESGLRGSLARLLALEVLADHRGGAAGFGKRSGRSAASESATSAPSWTWLDSSIDSTCSRPACRRRKQQQGSVRSAGSCRQAVGRGSQWFNSAGGWWPTAALNSPRHLQQVDPFHQRLLSRDPLPGRLALMISRPAAAAAAGPATQSAAQAQPTTAPCLLLLP